MPYLIFPSLTDQQLANTNISPVTSGLYYGRSHLEACRGKPGCAEIEGDRYDEVISTFAAAMGVDVEFPEVKNPHVILWTKPRRPVDRPPSVEAWVTQLGRALMTPPPPPPVPGVEWPASPGVYMGVSLVHGDQRQEIVSTRQMLASSDILFIEGFIC